MDGSLGPMFLGSVSARGSLEQCGSAYRTVTKPSIAMPVVHWLLRGRARRLHRVTAISPQDLAVPVERHPFCGARFAIAFCGEVAGAALATPKRAAACFAGQKTLTHSYLSAVSARAQPAPADRFARPPPRSMTQQLRLSLLAPADLAVSACWRRGSLHRLGFQSFANEHMSWYIRPSG